MTIECLSERFAVNVFKRGLREPANFYSLLLVIRTSMCPLISITLETPSLVDLLYVYNTNCSSQHWELTLNSSVGCVLVLYITINDVSHHKLSVLPQKSSQIYNNELQVLAMLAISLCDHKLPNACKRTPGWRINYLYPSCIRLSPLLLVKSLS